MIPERRCVSCQKLAPRNQFWRVVRTPTGEVVLDQGMGRSAYICPNSQCVEMAQKRKKLAKALRANIPTAIWQTLYERLQ